MSDQAHAAVSRLSHRLALMVGRGRISQSNDSGPVQIVQIPLNAKETPDLMRVGEFGHASWPPDGTDGIVVFIGGDRSNGVVLGTHHLASRFKLGAKGESALFDAFGKSIWLKAEDGGIVVEANQTPVTVNNAKGITINNADADITINCGGQNVILNNPAIVQLAGAGGKKVALDQDPVVGGKVQASSQHVTGL